jgi:hypothetical protein
VGSFLRRPLGLFAAILVVGFIVIAVGMKATGGRSGLPQADRPLTPAQFSRAGLHICLSIRAQLKALAAEGKPRNLRQVTRFSRKLRSLIDRVTTELNGLIPPPAAAASFRRMRLNIDVFDGAVHRLDHLAQTHQWRRLVLLVRSPWWKNIEKRFGPPTKLGHMHCGPSKPVGA